MHILLYDGTGTRQTRINAGFLLEKRPQKKKNKVADFSIFIDNIPLKWYIIDRENSTLIIE